MRNRKGVDPHWRRSREELGGIERREIVNRIYCMSIESILNKWENVIIKIKNS